MTIEAKVEYLAANMRSADPNRSYIYERVACNILCDASYLYGLKILLFRIICNFITIATFSQILRIHCFNVIQKFFAQFVRIDDLLVFLPTLAAMHCKITRADFIEYDPKIHS